LAGVIRRLLNVLAGVCLVLFVAICVLWVRSFWISDSVAFVHRHARLRATSVAVGTLSGSFELNAAFLSKSDYGDPRNTLLQLNSQPAGRSMAGPLFPLTDRRLGFGWWQGANRGRFGFAAPGWFIALLPAVVATLAIRHNRRRRRVERLGLCPRCGYDLRASPERCPECGTPTPRLTP
jgi:hypothetical protein